MICLPVAESFSSGRSACVLFFRGNDNSIQMVSHFRGIFGAWSMRIPWAVLTGLRRLLKISAKGRKESAAVYQVLIAHRAADDPTRNLALKGTSSCQTQD